MTRHDGTLYEQEFSDRETGKTMRLTVDSNGEPVLAIESTLGELNQVTIRGGEGLLIWLQAVAEVGANAMQRYHAARERKAA